MAKIELLDDVPELKLTKGMAIGPEYPAVQCSCGNTAEYVRMPNVRGTYQFRCASDNHGRQATVDEIRSLARHRE